jgi:hypothetical protein
MYGLMPSGRIPVPVEDAPVDPDATGCDATALPPGDVDCPALLGDCPEPVAGVAWPVVDRPAG